MNRKPSIISNDTIYTNFEEIIGNNNIIKGYRNVVKGNYNKIIGHLSIIIGNNCEVIGNENVCYGKNITIIGGGNTYEEGNVGPLPNNCMNEECIVCFEKKLSKDMIILPCMHKLCPNCYKSWEAKTCPLCRTSYK